MCLFIGAARAWAAARHSPMPKAAAWSTWLASATSVAAHVPVADDLVILGPGTVHEQLARDIELTDKHARRTRLIACRTAAPLTEPQLIAELRSEIGVPAPRKKPTRRPERKAPKPTDDSLVELDTLVDDPNDRSR